MQNWPEDVCFYILSYCDPIDTIQYCLISKTFLSASKHVPLSLRFNCNTFVNVANGHLFERLSVRELEITTRSRRTIRKIPTEILASCKSLGGLTSLILVDYFMDIECVNTLAKSPLLGQLKRLHIHRSFMNDAKWNALLDSPFLTQLTDLDFTQNSTNILPLSAILNSKISVEHLTVIGCGYGSVYDLEQLLKLNQVLKRLHVSSLNLDSIQLLASSSAASNLTELSKFDNIGGEGLKLITSSTNLKNLTKLDLSHNALHDTSVKTIVNMNHLTSLDLSRNDIGSETIQILASSRSLSKLKKLNVSHTTIGDEGVKYIAYSPFMKNLTRLIAQSVIATNFSCIGTSANMSNLVELDVRMNENISEESIHAILNSTVLHKLTRLLIMENDDRVAILIENSSLFSNLEHWSPKRTTGVESNFLTRAVDYLIGIFK